MFCFKYFTCYFLLALNLFACAQTKFPVKSIYATYNVVLPGNIGLDSNDREIPARDTVNFIYIETPAKNIQWNAAWKNYKTYSVLFERIESNSIDAGVSKIINKKIIIQASSANNLWKLRLIPSEKEILPPEEIAPGEILLQGTYKGQKIFRLIPKQAEVISIPSQ